ncbi:MAG: respiratory chain complex I subunit 1 family protein [Deltaproteobacteria bacterium]
MKAAAFLLSFVFFAGFAPLLSGLIAKIKNALRMRVGPGVLQPYYDLAKLFSKEEAVSPAASWIFTAAPFVVLASALAAALLVPAFIGPAPLRQAGDLLALLFILGLGRFFLALAALDTGSSFGGMGSSREMFIAGLAEPAFVLVVFSLSLHFGSTAVSASSGMHAVSVSCLAAAGALFLLTLAETARIPVDNQETHLELTMVHEAMLLEYSGRSLALLELAAHVKQAVFFFLIAQVVFPIEAPAWGSPAQAVSWLLWYGVRLALLVVLVALVEISVAKMRLFRVADLLGFAFALGVLSLVCVQLGV